MQEEEEEDEEETLWNKARKGLVTVEEAQAIMNFLEAKRKGWEAEGVGKQGICKISVCKGINTFELTGYPFDAVLASASGSFAHSWCTSHLKKVSRRFDFSLYGEQGPFILARAWCHKANYFYNLWESSVDPAFTFTQAHVQSWPEPQEFANFALGASPEQFTAVKEIRALSPILG